MNHKESYGYGFIMLLISPMLSLYYILRSSDKTYIRWMLVLFATIYASTFNKTSIGDGVDHWSKVRNYYVDLPFHQFIYDLWDILLFKFNPNVNEDVYIHVLSYFTGRILSAPDLFFVFVGIIYGYFFSGSMVRVFHIFPSFRKHFPFFVLAMYFIAMLNLKAMITVRTWTGFWVLFYGVISYYRTGNKRYLLYLFFPPFIHVGFFVMVIPILAIVFLPIPKTIILSLYIVSFSSTIINPQYSLKQLKQYEVGQEKIDGYYREEVSSIQEKYQTISSKSRWYNAYKRSGILSWAIVLITLVFIYNGNYFSDMNRLESKMFSIGVLTKVLSNTSWFISQLSGRSDTISALFILAALILYWQRKHLCDQALSWKPLSRPIFYVGVFLVLPSFVYTLSDTMEYLSAYFIILPELAWLGEDARITVREVLGLLLDIG